MRATLSLREWQRGFLPSVRLGPDGSRLAASLTIGGLVAIRELTSGLEVEAHAHVGRVDLGEAVISIEPKLAPSLLPRLVRHALGLRSLTLLPPTTMPIADSGLEALLLCQLVASLDHLLLTGLPVGYVATASREPSPRGRLLPGPTLSRPLALPRPLVCEQHRLVEGGPDGPALAALLCSLTHKLAPPLSRLLAPRVRSLEARVGPAHAAAPLPRDPLPALRPIFVLARLLEQGAGPVIEGEGRVRLPGFLLDMNRLFQAFVGALLRRHLTTATVHEEHPLTELVRYAPGKNPRARPTPRPRPDFAIRRGGKLVALLDAKYRDLWELSLPAEMLYQLSVYALSTEGGEAVIIYPTESEAACEAQIELKEQSGVWGRRKVTLRPLLLHKVVDLLDRGEEASLSSLADHLVTG